tara:strand:- start:823 stop:1575 length:753 start_codon:yes stop_codon:yes gene_type:complete
MEKYTHLKIIQDGLYGKVVLAQNNISSTKVVIKYINEHKHVKAQDEINTMKSLKHQNIVKYIEDSEKILVLEYLNGYDLYDCLYLKKIDITYDDKINIFKQCVLATKYLHSKNIIHCDIKCENIMILPNKTVKLIDFGLACHGINPKYRIFKGTVEYSAPEKLDLFYNKTQCVYYGSKVDNWSLGVLLYELYSLKLPFFDNKRENIISKIIKDKVKYNNKIPFFIFSLIIGLLKKSPTDRICLSSVLENI